MHSYSSRGISLLLAVVHHVPVCWRMVWQHAFFSLRYSVYILGTAQSIGSRQHVAYICSCYTTCLHVVDAYMSWSCMLDATRHTRKQQYYAAGCTVHCSCMLFCLYKASSAVLCETQHLAIVAACSMLRLAVMSQACICCHYPCSTGCKSH